MSKQAIPNEFELMGFSYKLAYFPNLQDVNSIPPDFSSMRVMNKGFKEFSFNNLKKFFIWKSAIIPATSMTPEKNFLMFAITDNFTQPDFIQPHEMICYSLQPKEQVDLEQQFINCIFGINNEQNGAEKIKTDWANDLFTVEENEQQNEADGLYEDSEVVQ